MNLRITHLIPAVLIIFTLIGSFLMLQYNLSESKRQIQEDTLSQLRLDMSRLQNILYNLLTEDNLADARLNISVKSMDPTVTHLLLTDENHQILIANQYRWENSPATSLQVYDPELAAVAQTSKQSQVLFDASNPALLRGYYPIILEISNPVSQKKRIGTIFIQKSLERQLSLANSNAIEQSIVYGSIMLLVSMAIAMFLHFSISRRLAVLIQASKRLANGNLDVEINLAGNDELSDLGHAFEDMRNQLADYIGRHVESEKVLRNLNTSLEERIDERTSQLKEAQSIGKIGNLEWDVNKGTLYWSDEIYRIFGLQVGEIEPSYERFLDTVHPEDRQHIESAVGNTLETGENYSIDHRILIGNNEVRWLHEEGRLIKGDGVKKIIGIAQDITERKRELIERESLEKQLMHSQKMESLGQLTGGIAHDFNNMLASISGFTDLAKRVINNGNTEKALSYLNQVSHAGNRAASLVAQMLTFSKTEGDILETEELPVSIIIGEVSSLLRPMLPSSIDLNVNLSEDDPLLGVNIVMMNQVLMNLCLNSRDAMDGRTGTIDINVHTTCSEKNLCSSCHHPVEGEYVSICVHDNGHGIAEENLTRLFEPFFSTKEVGKGTGMGLSMVHGIIHKHNGHILVESTPGYGTSVELLLPIYGEDTMAGDDTKHISTGQTETTHSDNQCIMIVDDEISIADYLDDLLQLHGYQTAIFNNSEEALGSFIQSPGKYNLVITDQTMPILTGVQLAKRMLSISPELPIILCTGYSDQIDEFSALAMNFSAYMEKPVNSDALLKNIEKLLAAKQL